MFGLQKATAANCRPHSDPSDAYNCLAWAVHNQDFNIWPDPELFCSWPVDMTREETIDNVVTFCERLGYKRCQGPLLEDGIEKIVIYQNSAGPTHASRQLPNGEWASKLGPLIDVIHTDPFALYGTNYGYAALYMQRSRALGRPVLPELHPPRPNLITTSGAAIR